MELSLRYLNLNFGRRWRDHLADIKAMAQSQSDLVDVICLLEVRRTLRFNQWIRKRYHIVQRKRSNGDPGGEVILVKRQRFGGPVIRRRGFKDAAISNFGERLGDRDFPWVALGEDTFIMLVHMPPLRMRGPLYAAYERRATELLRQHSEKTKIVVGDMNALERFDPIGMAEAGFTWFGDRIDLLAAKPERAVISFNEYVPKGRRDNHTLVKARIKCR